MKIIDLSIALLGLFFCLVLFYRFPRLDKLDDKNLDKTANLSIIIPARNEEKNIALLLSDLKKQSLQSLEIIVVDDGSSDNTAKIAESFGVKVIKITNKPNDWVGKSWACQKGADAANGGLLLFLDADVRLEKNSLKRLVKTQHQVKTTISVQPYHQTKNFYEQFSAIFNIVQTAANGVALPWKQTLGLFGPVILIPRSDYIKIGGHESVKNMIVEDVALGIELKKAGLSFRLYVSDGDISYRMYSDGFISLFHGWSKNIALGAIKMHILNFLMIFTLITSLLSVPSHIVIYALSVDFLWMIIYCVLYVIWVSVLLILAVKVGKFNPLTIIFFPVLVIFFCFVFVFSLFIKIFRLKYKWKGRSISSK